MGLKSLYKERFKAYAQEEVLGLRHYNNNEDYPFLMEFCLKNHIKFKNDPNCDSFKFLLPHIDVRKNGVGCYSRVLFLNNKKIGFVIYLHKEKENIVEIAYMGIDEKFQNKKYGSSLYQFLESNFKQSGVKKIILEVAAESDALRFYERLGYKKRSLSWCYIDGHRKTDFYGME